MSSTQHLDAAVCGVVGVSREAKLGSSQAGLTTFCLAFLLGFADRQISHCDLVPASPAAHLWVR